MGVFAKLFRRTQATEETPAAEQPAGSPEEGAEPDGAEGATQAPDEAGKGAEAAQEATEIPQQQSAEKAADSQTGDGART